MKHSPQNIRFLADTIQSRFPVEAQVLREVALDLECRKPITVDRVIPPPPPMTTRTCPNCYAEVPFMEFCNCPQSRRNREQGEEVMRALSAQVTAADPKATAATGKTRLDLVPPAASKACADALAFGAFQAGKDGKGYGPWNWRLSEGIALSTYVAAAKRHLDDLMEGEDCAPDSKVHHAGHIMAGMAIVLDALKHGRLIDDRVKPK